MAKSQEHSFLMYGWQKNFANKLIGEWRKYIAELDKLPSLHAQSTHTHPVKTYDAASFNAHNNLINGMKSVTFDVTIDKTGKKTNIVENDLFPNIIENMSQSVSAQSK